jgi:hypothetical protein
MYDNAPNRKRIYGLLEREGFKILKRQIQESRVERLTLLAKSQFVDQHLERIDQLDLINQEMWGLYRKEKDTFKQVLILEKIAVLQTYFHFRCNSE